MVIVWRFRGSEDKFRNQALRRCLENIGMNSVPFFLSNWIAVFRGFKLMEINFATAVFQVMCKATNSKYIDIEQ